MSRPAIDLMPHSPLGCCFAGPWAVGKVCKPPSWPRNMASSTVSALLPGPSPASCPPKLSLLAGPWRKGQYHFSVLLSALNNFQLAHLCRDKLFFPKNIAIKTLTNGNMSVAQRACTFSSHHFSRLWSSGAWTQHLPGSRSPGIRAAALYVFSPVLFGSLSQVSVFTGEQFLNQRKASCSAQFQ